MQRLHRFFLMLYHNLLVLLHIDILSNHSIRTQPQRQTYDETDAHLPHNLVFSFQAILITAEYLDVVVKETQKAQPYSGDNHQDDIDVPDTAKQERRHQNTNDDDDATHGRHTFLLYPKGIYTRITLCLKDFPTLHPLDEPFTKPGGDEQCQNQCQQGTKRYIGPHM